MHFAITGSMQLVTLHCQFKENNECTMLIESSVCTIHFSFPFQGGGQQILIQQPQQAQIIQMPDGQTFICQPNPVDNSVQQQQPTCMCLRISKY